MPKNTTPFFIRTPDKSKKQAPLYIRAQDKERGIDIKFHTDIFVEPEEWSRISHDEYAFALHQAKNKELHKKLLKIETLLSQEMDEPVFDKEKIKIEILKISESDKLKKLERLKASEDDALSELERVQSEYKEKLEEDAERLRSNIWNFIENFCVEIEDGRRRNKGERYTTGSCKSWKSFKSLYARFDPHHRYTWQQIDRKFANRFITFLEENYNTTSVNKHIGNIKAIINFSMMDELHDNARAIQFFHKKREKDDGKATDVWLTDNELDALFAMQIDDEKDREVRDVFLVGCYTCQRVSDYKAIPRDCIEHTDKGTLVINLTQKKTGNKVCIPVIGTNLNAILERYNYCLPAVNDQFLNKRIKIILQELSENVPTLQRKVPVLLKRGRGGTLPDEKDIERDELGRVVKPRYECVTSHTARRTGITRLYNTKLFDDVQLMAISGHRDLKIFREYIKLSAEELADQISEIAKTKPTL